MTSINIAIVTPQVVFEAHDSHADTMFDAMLLAQETLGQITWSTVTWNIAIGTTTDSAAVPVAVFDLDTANGMEVIRTTNWVNNGGDYPAITR